MRMIKLIICIIISLAIGIKIGWECAFIGIFDNIKKGEIDIKIKGGKK